MQWDIGLDLGETGIRLATRQKGVVLCAPSCGAIRAGEIFAIGTDAYAMLGRNPKNVSIERPISSGRIANPRLIGLWIQQLLEPFVSAARFNRPRVLLADSGFFNLSEKEMLIAAVMEAGAQTADWISGDLLTARGALIDMHAPKGEMCVNIGAGTMSASIVCGGRVLYTERLPWGISRMDRDIIHLLRSKAALSIGEKTAESVKHTIASAHSSRELKMHIVGLDMKSGFPVEKEISSSMIRSAIDPIVDALSDLILRCAEKASGELSADLLEEGVLLAGGGALLSGLDQVLSERTQLHCRVCSDPENAVINGMADFLKES